jgi:hypothetical protein
MTRYSTEQIKEIAGIAYITANHIVEKNKPYGLPEVTKALYEMVVPEEIRKEISRFASDPETFKREILTDLKLESYVESKF